MAIQTQTSIQLGQSWQTELGPHFVVDELAERLRLCPERVVALAQVRVLIELRDDLGTRLYPAFGFAEGRPRDGGVRLLPGLNPVLAALARSCREEWLWALWLSGWNPRHNGNAPIDALRRGDTRVLEAARNEDWSWTSRYF